MPTLSSSSLRVANAATLPSVREYLHNGAFDRPRELDQLLRSTRNPAAETLFAEFEGQVVGVASWVHLSWDSSIYGFPAARVEFVAGSSAAIRRDLLEAVLDSARNQEVRHMIARVDAGDIALAQLLGHSRFELIDGIHTFELSLPASLQSSTSIQTRLFQAEDLQQILDLARSAYSLDRFHADSSIAKETADRINEEWLRNSCCEKLADAVLVALSGGTVLGYATCRIDRQCASRGAIVMVATAARARRQGVGAACTFAAIEWFEEQGVTTIEVGTQHRNIPAARLYEQCGFRIAANSLTFRILL